MESAELDQEVLDRLTTLLRSAGLIGGARLRACLMRGGRSNLTYEIFSGEQSWVLRRPPAGHLLATAHDVGREYRVLASSLTSSIPPARRVAIVHGDFRLDNCIVRAGQIQAVLDWEMSTLGDPMSDLGLFVLYYEGLADIDNPVVESPGGSGSFPRADVLLDRYARRTTGDLSDLTWYVAFAWFKFAVMLEGIHRRSSAHSAEGSHFEGVADLVQPSVDRGLAALRTAGVA